MAMTNTKTLLIDMDAIVADLASEWYARWNKQEYDRYAFSGGKKPGEPLTVDMVTSWDVAKVIGTGAIYEILRQPGLYRALKPFPMAQKVIKDFSKLKLNNGKPAFNIVFVTASIVDPMVLSDKAIWMKEHFPFISPKQMVYAYQKELVRGDFFIDDSPKNLKRWKEANPKGQLITIDYPYNQNVQVDLRARSYKDMDAAWIAIRNYLEAMVAITQEA